MFTTRFTRFPGRKGKFAGQGTTAPEAPGFYTQLHGHTATLLNILKLSTYSTYFAQDTFSHSTQEPCDIGDPATLSSEGSSSQLSPQCCLQIFKGFATP